MKAILSTATVLTVAALVGGALGLASGHIYVFLLDSVALGLAVGAAAAVAHLTLGLRPGRSVPVMLGLGCLVGVGVIEGVEDWHFQSAWAKDLAQSRFAASGAGGGLSPDPDELAFYMVGADEALAEDIQRQVGRSDGLGRWLVRAQSGVRLFGTWDRGYGLPLGVPGAALELILAWLVAFVVGRNVCARATAPPLSDPTGAAR